MAYTIRHKKEESAAQLKELIEAFGEDHAGFKASTYKEAQLRIDFLNPLLKSFGWDVDNENKKSQFLRDVIQEENIDVEDDDAVAKKNPDYTLRMQGTRKLFVEAKKVSVDVEKSATAAFQVRRYGWSANLGISILTNFENLVVYDCRIKPAVSDDPSAARYRVFHFTQFMEHFEELYRLLSFESVQSGFIDDYFSLTETQGSTFDDYFHQQIESWRVRLAEDIVQNNSGFNEEDINFLVQRLINRVVFLRICEDREIERYEALKAARDYEQLKSLFTLADKKYNSGLFDFIEDHFSMAITLRPETLIEIFGELYYPESPYDFSVVDPTVLSHIYERYLGSRIAIGSTGQISVIEEPEVAVSSGVVSTPGVIVTNIVKETLSLVLEGKSPEQVRQLRFADICCGAGTFLLSVYDYIAAHLTDHFATIGGADSELAYKLADGTWQLTLKSKQELLTGNIFGVDINPYAAEVTKFSLVLKLLENENAGSIDYFLKKYKQKILPSLDGNIKTGNSLVDEKFYEFDPSVMEDEALLHKVKPFSWADAFPFLQKAGGFDAIIGNPPYVRIQNMVKYQAEEIKFYQDKASGFTVAATDTFDKYYMFIQRAVSLLNAGGVLGYIVPNKFFITKGGKALRGFISSHSVLSKIIHFGVTQVFPGRSTYTAILILDKVKKEHFLFKRIRKVSAEFNTASLQYSLYNTAAFTAEPWVFVSPETEAVLNKIRTAGTVPLGTTTDILVGLQTSADGIYIFTPYEKTAATYKFRKNGTEYEIEAGICKPCLYDASFAAFDTIGANAQIIFPYTVTGNKAELFEEAYFQNNFPLAWAYLQRFQTDLSKRSFTTRTPKWYQYGRSQNIAKFHDTEKLIWPVLSTQPAYIYDGNNLQFTGGGNGPYYSLTADAPYSVFYILGILSHPVFEYMVKVGASEFRGAYYSHGKQFIENLPIKAIDFNNGEDKSRHDAIVATVLLIIAGRQSYNQAYLASKKATLQGKLAYLTGRLKGQVNTLYGISTGEMDTVLHESISLTGSNED